MPTMKFMGVYYYSYHPHLSYIAIMNPKTQQAITYGATPCAFTPPSRHRDGSTTAALRLRGSNTAAARPLLNSTFTAAQTATMPVLYRYYTNVQIDFFRKISDSYLSLKFCGGFYQGWFQRTHFAAHITGDDPLVFFQPHYKRR